MLLLNKEKVCLKIKRSPILDIEKELAKHMQIIRSQHPYKELPSITKDTTPFSSVFEGCFIIDTDGVKIYNTYMDSYYDREEKYYRVLLEKKCSMNECLNFRFLWVMKELMKLEI